MNTSLSSDYANSEISAFLALPTELIQTIFFKLDSIYIFNILPNVCKRFRAIVNDNFFWKSKMLKKWALNYPSFNVGPNFDYKLACLSREFEERRWKDSNLSFASFEKSATETYSALTVIENERLAITGSRERTISLIDIQDSLDKNILMKRATISKSHNGWIWSLSHCDGMLASGSFDTYLKLWDLTSLKELHRINFHSAVLCSRMDHNEVVAGSFNGYAHIVDTRTYQPLFKERIHNKCILDIKATENELISTGEDKRIVIFDKRTSKIRQQITLPNYAMTISLDRNELWVGDVKGAIHLLGPLNTRLTIVESMETTGRKIYQLAHNAGSMLTLDSQNQLNIYEPSRKANIIKSLYSKGDKFCYTKEFLVTVGDMYVGIHHDDNLDKIFC